MTNILELYIKFKNWQGGTIHQVHQDFKTLTFDKQVEFINILENNKGNIPVYQKSDINWFKCDI